MGTAGFVRIQTSFQDEKENICFKAPGASTKYRLGNECETWLELSVFQDLNLENGVVIHNSIRPTFLGDNEKSIKFLRFDEAYTEVQNLFHNSASIWIGRRFYKRYDSYLSDYFFLNMSGDGVGVNNLDLGDVKLSYSYIFNTINQEFLTYKEDVLLQSHDIRVLKDVTRGEYTLFLNYMSLENKTFQVDRKIDVNNGYAVGLIYKDTKIFEELLNMKGNNISALFYGKGLARGAGTYSAFLQEPLVEQITTTDNAIDDSTTWRFINYNSFENDSWGLISNFVYEYKDDEKFTNTKQDWLSICARPYWFLGKNTALVLEAGYDRVNNKINNETYGLTKITPAFELTLDKGIWKRPVVRFFYTYASWSANAKGLIGTGYYANATSGNNTGIQLEYWW